jgi:hypothetical protein
LSFFAETTTTGAPRLTTSAPALPLVATALRTQGNGTALKAMREDKAAAILVARARYVVTQKSSGAYVYCKKKSKGLASFTERKRLSGNRTIPFSDAGLKP